MANLCKQLRTMVFKKIVVLGLMIGFGVTTTFAIGETNIPLPEAGTHGYSIDKNRDNGEPIQLPNGVTNFHFQRFSKNGKAESPDDFCIVSFIYENESIVIHFTFSELCEKGYIDCGVKANSKDKVFRLI